MHLVILVILWQVKCYYNKPSGKKTRTPPYLLTFQPHSQPSKLSTSSWSPRLAQEDICGSRHRAAKLSFLFIVFMERKSWPFFLGIFPVHLFGLFLAPSKKRKTEAVRDSVGSRDAASVVEGETWHSKRDWGDSANPTSLENTPFRWM